MKDLKKLLSIMFIFVSIPLLLSLIIVSSTSYGSNWIPYDKDQKPVLDENNNIDKNNTSIRYWKDIKTSLLWTNANSKTVITKKWIDAVKYCINLNHSGISSWRLPDVEEVNQAYKHGIFNLNNSEGIGKLDKMVFWSLSSTPIYTYYAWMIDFSTGEISPFIKLGDLGVLCVKNKNTLDL